VADLEQAVPVTRPADLPEQAVLERLVVAGAHLVALLPRPHVPLLRHHDRRRVRGEPEHAVVEHARREDVGAVDHERQRLPGRERGPAVQRAHWRRGRLGAEVDVPELRSEAPDELGIELLLGRGAVLDDDHLVCEVVDVTLVGA
jgi:hypothetical protein